MELCTLDLIWYFRRGRVIVHAQVGKDSCNCESNFCIHTYGDKSFKCDHFNKKCSAVFSFSTFYDDVKHSLRKRLTFRDATIGYPAKWHLRKELINYVFYPYLGGASDCMKQIFNQSEALTRSG